jgi:hypothetical protein
MKRLPFYCIINLMSEKVIGYILLIAGVAIICLVAFNIYQIFNLKAKPVNLFHFNSLSIDSSQLVPSQPEVNTEGLSPEQGQVLENLFKTQSPKESSKIEVIPADVLNQTTNLFAHLFLLGFIASAGYRIASIGVLMLRPIVVKLKEKQETPQKNG